jgi:hypothetical protein
MKLINNDVSCIAVPQLSKSTVRSAARHSRATLQAHEKYIYTLAVRLHHSPVAATGELSKSSRGDCPLLVPCLLPLPLAIVLCFFCCTLLLLLLVLPKLGGLRTNVALLLLLALLLVLLVLLCLALSSGLGGLSGGVAMSSSCCAGLCCCRNCCAVNVKSSTSVKARSVDVKVYQFILRVLNRQHHKCCGACWLSTILLHTVIMCNH